MTDEEMIFEEVALRKESVDRNLAVWAIEHAYMVALRKESVDRNVFLTLTVRNVPIVALRKESVDRNIIIFIRRCLYWVSLSARRAWIEMPPGLAACARCTSRSPQGERG